jgi:hypothetical protein
LKNTRQNMDESWKQSARWKEASTPSHLLHVSIYLKFPELHHLICLIFSYMCHAAVTPIYAN